jgi:hypothetical protein
MFRCEAFSINLVDVLRSRWRAANTRSRSLLRHGRTIPARNLRESLLRQILRFDVFRREGLQRPLLFGCRGRVDVGIKRRAKFGCNLLVMFRSLPVRAVISAASRSMIGPSLSVVHTVPSNRRKLAPALFSAEAVRAVDEARDEPRNRQASRTASGQGLPPPCRSGRCSQRFPQRPGDSSGRCVAGIG